MKKDAHREPPCGSVACDRPAVLRVRAIWGMQGHARGPENTTVRAHWV